MKIRVNLNNYASIELTERGRKVWHDAWAPYSKDGLGMDHKINAEGVLREQLWHLMQVFGPTLGSGKPSTLASVEIEIEDATESEP